MKELVTVVVPVCNKKLSPFEEKLLARCADILGDFPLLFISGESTHITDLQISYPKSTHYTFKDAYFQDRTSFSKLLLTGGFYERFDWSDFILVVELNSYILRNELRYWCKQGYDFIQAPPTVLSKNPSIFKALTGPFENFEPTSQAGEELASSGLSLRKVEKVRKALVKYKREVHSLKNSPGLTNFDSLFWERQGGKFWPYLQIPTTIVRERFALYANHYFSETIAHQKPFGITGLVESTNFEALPD
ncbi:DUF5672 family protein [Telluribacter sp.]|jgi:hypothetical protein|uniref:DUF5672 family protein n=1 Tax=Telluribacter sp. TaxID=1978767 RepID=UPI002E145373|nr:DUF5672 family protein [Telluribacter sp.]